MTGEPLGSRGPAVPVEVSLEESTQQPRPIWRRLFSPWRPKGVTIYVCCPDCVGRVNGDPLTYLRNVIAERGGWLKR